MTTIAAPLPPLSLYVHLPWCVRKCPYCDFNSHALRGEPPMARYVDALLADMHRELEFAGGRPLASVFFGGGTPSLFPAGAIARILDAVRAGFDIADDIEITLEANPGTVECADVGGYRDAGVNRLSFGAQSFDAAMLEALGRIHSVVDIERSVEAARAAGFDNVNLDLMYALPGQTVPGAVGDLQRAIDLRPQHISWYQLTLEPNTVFHARPPAGLPDEDAAWAMQEEGQALLDRAGYDRYETSAYALPGYRCRHNLNYWRFGDYLAIGAGAHGKYTSADGIWRYAKPSHPLAYIEAQESGTAAARDARPVRADDRVFEYMLNVLRLTEPFTEAGFAERTGLPGKRLHGELARLREQGLVEEHGGGVWRVSVLGERFLNDLQAAFLP